MLDELQAIGLLGLIACQYILIRGCFAIKDEIPLAGGTITTKIDRTADLLDEMAQLIADFTDGMTGSGNAPPPPSPFEAILTSFMSRTSMANHATPQQEWEILPNDNDPSQTVEAQN